MQDKRSRPWLFISNWWRWWQGATSTPFSVAICSQVKFTWKKMLRIQPNCFSNLVESWRLGKDNIKVKVVLGSLVSTSTFFVAINTSYRRGYGTLFGFINQQSYLQLSLCSLHACLWFENEARGFSSFQQKQAEIWTNIPFHKFKVYDLLRKEGRSAYAVRDAVCVLKSPLNLSTMPFEPWKWSTCPPTWISRHFPYKEHT